MKLFDVVIFKRRGFAWELNIADPYMIGRVFDFKSHSGHGALAGPIPYVLLQLEDLGVFLFSSHIKVWCHNLNKVGHACE